MFQNNISRARNYISPNTLCDVSCVSPWLPAGWSVLLTNSGMQAVSFLMMYYMHQGYTPYCHNTAFIETRHLCNDTHVIDIINDSIPNKSIVFIDNPDYIGCYFDLSKLSTKVHDAKSILVVDNTRVSIYGDTSFNYDVDYVVESYSKYGVGNGQTPLGGIYFRANSVEEHQKIILFAAAFGVSVMESQCKILSAGLSSLRARMERVIRTSKQLDAALYDANIPHMYIYGSGIFNLPYDYLYTIQNGKYWEEMSAYGFPVSTYCTCTDHIYFNNQHNDRYLRLSVGLEDADNLVADTIAALTNKIT